MSENSKPIANPLIVLREEFDDWAILFDPDSGDGFGLNPVSVFIWKRLDGKHTVKSIVSELIDDCKDVPGDVEMHVNEFIQDLANRGFVGHEIQRVTTQ
jgi:SynChlorMet cassette protein ScmD